ncbi:hypothetical protein BJ944DRAFT_264139 [Cunninghamella echinulata]|nr:hypothetical protein BJ944DRAFT_264139 [Cunninghamella echinulata]
MDSVKAELNKARCQGQWSTIPSLAFQFKKAYPDESVLEATCQIEAQLVQLVDDIRSQYYVKNNNNNKNETLRKTNFIQETIYGEDTPEKVTLPLRLQPAQVLSLQTELESLIQENNKQTLTTSNEWQAQLSKIILARIFFETGQYENALESLQNLALRLEDVNSGYGFILLVQARVIKGTCLELTGKEEDALVAFESAWTAVEEHLDESSPVLNYWIEDGLYRSIMLCLRTKAPIEKTLKFLRGYSQLSSSHWSTSWRIQKRWIVFKLYTDYLIETYSKGTYSVGCNEEERKRLAFDELFVLMNRCRSTIRAYASKLSTGEIKKQVVEFVNIMFKAHDIVGWGEISHIRRVQQFLYNAKSLTFNSPCIQRGLFYTLLRLGSMNEARYAFRSYMELVGLPDVDKTDENGIEITPHGVSLSIGQKVEMIQSKLKLIQLIDRDAEKEGDNDEDDHSVESKGSKLSNNETVIDVVQVLLVATQFLGRECNEGKQATIAADLAVGLCDAMDDDMDTSIDDVILVKCHRARGVAYGLLAYQSADPELRAQYQKEATMSLEIAVTLNDACWESHYELAIQQLYSHDIIAASESIARALKHNKDHLPSWHLLALVYSCQQYEKLPEALQTLELSLSETQATERLNNISMGLPAISWTGELNCRDTLISAETIIQIHLSQLACLSKLDGPDAALPQLPDLFSLYNTMTAYLGITEIMELEQDSQFTNDNGIPNLAPNETINNNNNNGDQQQQQQSPLPQQRNGRKVSRPEIRSITPIATPVNSNSIRNRSQPSTPNPTNNDNNESPTSSQATLNGSQTPVFVRRRLSGGSLTSFSSNPALVDGIRSRTPSQPNTNTRGLPESKPPGVVRRGSQSLKKSLQYMESSLSRRNSANIQSTPTLKPETKTNGPSPLTNTPVSGFSLASLLTPSLSMASMRSNISGRSSSFVTALGGNNSVESNTSQTYSKNMFLHKQRDRWNSLLMKIWLFTMDIYIQLNELEEANKVLMEMETLGAGEADVWYQMGRMCIKAMGPINATTTPSWTKQQLHIKEMALEAFKKALTLDEDHVDTHVELATLFIQMKEWEIAESLLDRTTKSFGWDNAQAWYQLGLTHQHNNLLERAKNCFLYALELNDTKVIRPVLNVLPRFT